MKKVLILFMLLIFGTNASFAANLMGDRAYYYTQTTEPVSGKAVKDKASSKVGKAEAIDILGLITTGDAGIQKACRNGDITKIDRVEQEFFSIYVLFEKMTTKCYGE